MATEEKPLTIGSDPQLRPESPAPCVQASGSVVPLLTELRRLADEMARHAQQSGHDNDKEGASYYTGMHDAFREAIVQANRRTAPPVPDAPPPDNKPSSVGVEQLPPERVSRVRDPASGSSDPTTKE